jgi:hypothetical protein
MFDIDHQTNPTSLGSGWDKYEKSLEGEGIETFQKKGDRPSSAGINFTNVKSTFNHYEKMMKCAEADITRT